MAIRPLLLVKPATAVKWHRKGFSIYWRRIPAGLYRRSLGAAQRFGQLP
jgi:hypothetical protein